MRILVFLSFFIFSFSFGQLVHPTDNIAFLQNEVASVYIQISPADLNLILSDSLYSDHEFPATFRYLSSISDETVLNVGFRLRGNTSATNQLQVIQNLENPCKLSLDGLLEKIFTPLRAFDLMGNEIKLQTTNKAKLLVNKYGNTKIVWTNE